MMGIKEFPRVQMNQNFVFLRTMLHSQLHLNLVLGLPMRKHTVVITRIPQCLRVENFKIGR